MTTLCFFRRFLAGLFVCRQDYRKIYTDDFLSETFRLIGIGTSS